MEKLIWIIFTAKWA